MKPIAGLPRTIVEGIVSNSHYISPNISMYLLGLIVIFYKRYQNIFVGQGLVISFSNKSPLITLLYNIVILTYYAIENTTQWVKYRNFSIGSEKFLK